MHGSHQTCVRCLGNEEPWRRGCHPGHCPDSVMGTWGRSVSFHFVVSEGSGGQTRALEGVGVTPQCYAGGQTLCRDLTGGTVSPRTLSSGAGSPVIITGVL